MKTIFITATLFFLTFFTLSIHAQDTNSSTINDYVVLTKTIEQLQPIILTAKALKQDEGVNFGKFEVIICGKQIGDITSPEKMGDFISKANAAGVQIIACGFSLNKFKVNKTKVPKEIITVENGILYNFQLQKKGYKSITL
ncbi:sulfur reduction protein DsrE [Confluentibacter flavum]|uniref:Sulfur reduction protein DsrE n=1 Tax=Confluentibacter flavum TaxID=1909700 RepID=A0A2N3HP71_9FLAO|nr:sulfur reduction protein DsrE [Confluentibacter flavum]PKQ46783.1 sulfur reduction protein DsrE [Confluentibacter flavum]